MNKCKNCPLTPDICHGNKPDCKLPGGENEMDKWIPVTKRLPKERDSIFEKYYGTEKWDNAMFRKSSDNVIVTILLSDGTKVATEGVIRDGKWDIQMVRFRRKEILAWMPMPEPYKGDEQG